MVSTERRTDALSLTPQPRSPLPFDATEVEGSVVARFEKVVALCADHVAVEIGPHRLTYAELNQQANQVAASLLDLAGPAAEPVALLMAHDTPLLAAILGILKTGKFFSVLDPDHPPAYLSALLDDLDARWLIVDTAHAEVAEEIAGKKRRVVIIRTLTLEEGGINPTLLLPSDAPAAILYTSGSTGRPKGVLRSHRLTLHRAWLDHNELTTGSDDRIASLVLPVFTGAVSNMLNTLLSGATLLPFDARYHAADEVGAWIARQGITLLRPPLGLMRQFLAALEPKAIFPRLRLVDLGGDVLYRQDVVRFRQHVLPTCQFMHRYATSETGVVTRMSIDPTRDLENDFISVGYPVPDREVLILDEARRPVPPGEVGEIVVRGKSLAPGYWRRPELTDERFTPDPALPSLSHYYTGDLGRLLPDGRLVFMGRRDSQAKIRGYSVGLGTIESALLDLPVVSEAAVFAQPGPADEKRIVAYVVLKDKSYPIDHLRRGLAEVLPAHMLPSAFVTLDALPLTANGKVNRLGLPLPGRERPALATAFVAPQTTTERQLASLWQDVLGAEGIGIHDPFTDLGGDSLLASQVVSRINRAFQVSIPVRLLLQAATIADMAVLLDASGDERRAEGLPDLIAEMEQLSEAEAERLLRQGD
ncbi:MAG: non-ribosomal peptide synthetase [Anaerolineae bacterium]|nr:non-ribosomal peptide synthetase [Anaerolineae bacterium]